MWARGGYYRFKRWVFEREEPGSADPSMRRRLVVAITLEAAGPDYVVRARRG
jgi:hypothetical protein